MENPSLCALVAASTLDCEIHLSFYCGHCVLLIREISVSASIANSCLAPLMFFCGFLFIFSRWLYLLCLGRDSHFWAFCALNCVWGGFQKLPHCSYELCFPNKGWPSPSAWLQQGCLRQTAEIALF